MSTRIPSLRTLTRSKIPRVFAINVNIDPLAYHTIPEQSLTLDQTASRTLTRAMHIQSIPMWTGSSDNYAYLVVDDKSKDAVIIDPANPDEVAPVLKEQIKDGKINLTAIVNTHHHWDHSGGNKKLLGFSSEFGGKPIIGGKDCEGVTQTPKNGEGFKIGDISVKALYTPCHTQDSICWLMEDSTGRAIFTGDTLFHGGCGRFFEGTAEEMHTALNKTLAAVPDDTKVYPGHEYTKANVKFGISVLQSEAVKNLQAFAEKNKETQGKFTIADEKKHNVFMRVDDPEIQKATGETDPVAVMAKLREMKNNFKHPPRNRRVDDAVLRAYPGHLCPSQCFPCLCLGYDEVGGGESLLCAFEWGSRLIGVEYMITPRLYHELDAEERKLWHSHDYEVRSGMLILPNPHVPNALWEIAETEELKEVVGLYGKTWHFWQVDRGDVVPLGKPELMSFTGDEQVPWGNVKERDERFGVETRRKKEARKGIEAFEPHQDADGSKRRAPSGPEPGPPKVRQSKLAKEHNITGTEENEIREAFSLFSEKRKGEKEGVIPTGDVRRAMIALGILPEKSELEEFISILDPYREGFVEYEPFVGICALKIHARTRNSDTHTQEVNEAFALFTKGAGDEKITLATLKRIANDLKEEVGDDLLRDMILEANGGAGVGKGVEKDEFEEVLRRAGVWR
ncbi:hypothetical protein HYFRA_00009263 [Hymenoscyphus fraxineus]|uniref:hydroxyacylglutathione hydrolase n=1 Tax=Hymenoscyphus fraxineus TaxID=746836 RepID=A0A9N9L3T8_9HELO|nr:hypothetical protein HYFRA_00009263 [Hymenoscyphus fraxineus]